MTLRQAFQKGSVAENYTLQNFIIVGYKKPLLSSENILIRVADLSGMNLVGLFSEGELKKIPSRTKLRINSVLSKYKENGKIVYSVTFENLPKNIIIRVNETNIKSFLFSPAARDQYNKIK